MPYNLNFGDIGNLNVDMGLDPENFFKSDYMKRSIYGTPPPADVMRYPLKAIEKEQDMLLIRIFDQVDNKFGLKNIVQGQYQDVIENGKVVGNKLVEGTFERFGRLTSKNQAFNKEGSTYDGEKKLKANARYIWLPIPQQITDSITVGYSEDTLNPLQAAGMSLASDLLDDPVAAGEKVVNMMTQNDLLKGVDANTIQALKTSLAGRAINQLGANVNPQSLITRSSGQILQSNLELLFNNVTLRSFPFTFDFTPREPAEADMVKKIIRTIKKATVPKRGNGLFINSPDLFQLEYVAGGERQHPFLHKFKVGVVENVSVDYTASGTYATYSDRTPVHVRMSLSFKEINPIYMEDYDDAAAQDGDFTQGGVGY